MAEPELDPRLLKSFVAVAEELHFGRAARRLHISQPPLSVQIRKLEEVIGTRLFLRDRRRVELTEAGAFLHGRAKHLLSEAARACEEARRIGRGETGTLTVGYTATATYEILPRVVRAFGAAQPGVRLELVEMRSPSQPAALRTERIEVGLACGPLGQSDLVETVLARERVLLAVSAVNPLARRQRLRLAELRREPFVLVRSELEPAWANACSAALLQARIAPVVTQETDSKPAMLGLVAANLGVSLVSASVRRLGREGVVFLPIHDLSVRLPFVSLALPEHSPRAQAFLRLAARAGAAKG